MTSTSKKPNGTITGGTTGQVTTKSGKGASHGVVTELSAYFTIKPGHENELRAAALRFGGMLLTSDPKDVQRTGLRDARFVIFNDGRQLLFGSSFETDWDPYIDDAIDVVGVKHFVDWMQHTVEAEKLVAYIESLGGVEKFGKNDPAYDENLKQTSSKVKEVIQSVQTPAAAYFNALGSLTIPQIKKAQHVEEAFQRVLDNPAGEDQELVFSCNFEAPRQGGAGIASVQEGWCVTPSGETVRFRVPDEHGGVSNGVRVYAGLRADPFFIDKPALEESQKSDADLVAKYRQDSLWITVSQRYTALNGYHNKIAANANR